MKKFLFYLTFVALAMYCAEIISYNEPNILFIPTAYIGYGVVYVFFIHSILTRKVTKWSTVYLYGMLVGIITEAFLPKVLFFGWDASSVQFLGIAWFEVFILTFFYHPFFSFIVPVYIAKQFINFPFQLSTGKHSYKIIIPVIIMTLSSVGNVYLNGGGKFVQSLLSTVLLVALLLILKACGPIEDISLNIQTRRILFGIGFTFYLFVFVFNDVPHGGRFPEPFALILILLYIAGIRYLVIRELPPKYDLNNVVEDQIIDKDVNYKHNYYVEEKVEYRPDQHRIKILFTAIGYISILIVGSLLPYVIAPAIPFITFIVLIIGMILGVLYFLKCLFAKKGLSRN